jgi:2-oxoglutarate dehydrogenase E1 component
MEMPAGIQSQGKCGQVDDAIMNQNDTVSLTEFLGPNLAYVLELYERFQHDPAAVDEATRQFFAGWSPPYDGDRAVAAAPAATAQPAFDKAAEVANLAQSIREYGHLEAQLDPLGRKPPGDPSLALATHGLAEADLRRLPAGLVGGPIAARTQNALEAIAELRAVYSSRIGFDYDHIRRPEEREWLRAAAESRRYRPSQEGAYLQRLLDRLTQIEVFEQFLHRTFPSKYRFSLEGLDMMVPMLDEIIRHSAETGMTNILIGMAHRGRLNVLAHTMNKPYEQILAEFKDPLIIQELREAIGWTTGDVKYHEGTRHTVREAGEADAPLPDLVIAMPPNPSHLELVNPISVGMARAAGTRTDRPGAPEFNPKLTLQILIHGDAAFPGQGVVAETFNLSRVEGYWTGGTIHLIANNQLGFTTDPEDSRSTLYASDLAKGFKVPIIHVNADDPEACIEAARIAFAYQEYFEKDFLIDLVGYRRYGHNELDEPGFTQPVLYRLVRNHLTARQLWANALAARGVVAEAEAEAMVQHYMQQLQAIYDRLSDIEEQAAALAEPPLPSPPPGIARRIDTKVPETRILAINESLKHFPADFRFYSGRLESTIRSRRDAVAKASVEPAAEPAIDWATAEELAFATILEEGIAIRLTGQDSERGTFSHRHAVLNDAETGAPFVPLQVLPQASAAFEVRNSPLSEVAALGFEYGYNVQEPGRLVIWEAQYGDFINGAQSIVDEFIVSAREKWGQTPSLVLLLPHAWEGAGPDHSSGRLERFLQLAAKTNMRIANCTTAAQYFHLLRRQALLLESDPLPLIVMAPKSLLRNPAVASELADFTEKNWQPVISDMDVDAQRVRRVVLCSGKFYFDLVGSEYRAKVPHVAVVRVEQLYPFPAQDLAAAFARYPQMEGIVWAQEAPKNMEAWEFMQWRLARLVEGRWPVNYVGRRRSGNPAEGSSTAHRKNQSMIVEYAFNWQFAPK